MSEFNLNEMSLRELQDLKKKVDAAVASYEARKLLEARSELEAMAKEFGFTLAELVSADVKVKKTRKPTSPKWRHRENHDLTWTGQGKRPRWFDDAEPIPTQE